MSCDELTGNGESEGGDPNALDVPITTTDATPQTVVLARHPVDGAAASVELDIRGAQTGPAAADRGDRGGWFKAWIQSSRSAGGTNFLITGLIGPTGYEDPAGVPWTTVGVPVGWAFIGIAIVGTDLVITFNGAAGQTIQWRLRGPRSFAGGATP